jgi:hypothetical protein
MTYTDEQNLRAGIRILIGVAAKNTGDSAFYVARLAQDICSQLVQAELRKPSSNDGSK